MHHIRRVSGFTLLELLAVITIIGILATLAVVGITNATRRGRDARRNSDLVNIKQALELYAQDNFQYPAGTGTMATFDGDTGTATPTEGPLAALRTGGYLTSIPSDPRNISPFQYKYNSDASGTNYVLQVDLEDRRTRQSLGTPADCGTSASDLTTKGNGVLQNGNNDAACLRLVND